MALVVALGVAASGFFSLSLFHRSLRRSILQGAESLASSNAKTIDRYLDEALQDTEAIAAQLPRRLLQGRDNAGLANYLRQQKKLFPKFENGLFILTPPGDLFADYPVHSELHGKNFAFREYYQRAMQERRVVIGKPYVSARTGQLVLTFTAPLWGQDKELLGLLSCSVQLASPRALGGITQRRFGDTGYVYVYDSSRLMILHPQAQRIGKRDVPVGANLLYDRALQGFEGAGETVNSLGVAMLVAFSRIEGLDWVVAAQLPAAEAFAPLRMAKIKGLWVLLASAALAAGIGALAIRRVTLPLARLQQAAEQLSVDAPEVVFSATGNPDETLADLERTYAGGEIGGLAKTLREQQQRLAKSLGALRDAAQNWEQTFNSVRDAIFVVDKKYRIQRLNRAARELFQLPGDEAIGTPCYRLIHGSDQPPDFCPGRLTLASGRPGQVELTDSCLPGVFEETTTMLHEGGDGEPAVVHLLKDLTQLKASEAQVKRLAYYDSLTGLPNRALFMDRLVASLNACRDGERPAAVLFVDLDQFKGVNDTLGHSAGDQLLQVVARRLEGCLRQSDVVARFGGDEFVISVSNLGPEGQVGEIAGKLLKVLAQPMELGGEHINCSASIGIALFPQDGKDAETLIKHADVAMYQTKAMGRNGFQFFSEEMERQARENRRLAQVEDHGEGEVSR
ncbi:MAG: diguanylate cyclase [Desulfuromonadaceae bacterium]|nr:diguanylate cyclase [Desulfuromonadaceae bacterium]